MNCVAILVADIINRDSSTGKLSAINIVDKLTFDSIPAVIPSFNLAVIFEKTMPEENDFSFTLRIKRGEHQIVEREFQLQFSGKQQATFKGVLTNFTIDTLDPFIVEVEADGQTMRTTIPVESKATPQVRPLESEQH
jgi:hypothetical protein